MNRRSFLSAALRTCLAVGAFRLSIISVNLRPELEHLQDNAILLLWDGSAWVEIERWFDPNFEAYLKRGTGY